MKNISKRKSFLYWLLILSGLAAVVAILRPARNAHAHPDEKAASALGSWTQIWSDEFNGSGGINPSDWLYDTGTGYPGSAANWGTGEVETMTSGTSNVFQSGGYLHIQAIHTGSDPISGWTSGRIETQLTDFHAPLNGALAVEASIQLPNLTGQAAQGYWPAFWMLGAPFRGTYNNWPKVGEIDIMEAINGVNTWYGTFHCGTYPNGPCNEPSGIGGHASGFSPSLQAWFHTYRMEFDKSVSPEEIRWYVDGIQYFNVNSNQVDMTTWNNATNHGFFIILNVAIGGGWPGNPTSSTASGGTMLVDYVRAYTAPRLTYNISGNTGVGGVRLSYLDGTDKTATSAGNGNYTIAVPSGWSGTVTPSKTGYSFSPTSIPYTDVLADQTSQNYTPTLVAYTISGNAGSAGITLTYTVNGVPQTVISDINGNYILAVPPGWSGTVVPSPQCAGHNSLTRCNFTPGEMSYTNVQVNQSGQNYSLKKVY